MKGLLALLVGPYRVYGHASEQGPNQGVNSFARRNLEGVWARVGVGF